MTNVEPAWAKDPAEYKAPLEDLKGQAKVRDIIRHTWHAFSYIHVFAGNKRETQLDLCQHCQLL